MGGKHETGCVAGCAMVVRFTVCFPKPQSSGKAAAILCLSTRRCVKSVQSLSWQRVSLLSRKHVVLLGKCWFSSQRTELWCTPSRFLLEERARLLQMPVRYAPPPNGNTWLVLSYTFWFPFSMYLLTQNTFRASVCTYVPLSPTDLLMWMQPATPVFSQCLTWNLEFQAPKSHRGFLARTVIHLCFLFSLSQSVGNCSHHLTAHSRVSPSLLHWSGKCDRRNEEYNTAHGLVRDFSVLLLGDMIITSSSWPALNCAVSADQEHL